MFGLYPADVVRRAEQELMRKTPQGSLMHIAAHGLARQVLEFVADVRGAVAGAHVLLLVGAGNNGGDALFAGATLQRRGMAVKAVTLAESWHADGARALVQAGGSVLPIDHAPALIEKADVIVDGVVGIGARGPLRAPASEIVAKANSADALRIAVDIPSGVGVDDGSIEGVTFDADVTVTFGCFKPGLFLHPGRSRAGALRFVDIGLDTELPEPTMCVLDPSDVTPVVDSPRPDDHKYRRGVVGIAAGSPAYPGAALLTAGAARYAGVGMVRFLDRGDAVAQQVIAAFPDVVADPRDSRADERVRAWGCGPGFTEADAQAVRMVVAEPTPIVLDAGALHVLATDSDMRTTLVARAERGLSTVLTPHEGEYARLFGAGTPTSEAARTWGAIIVRKGPATTISGPDGRCFVDAAGTADLACAGSGDVLAGLMAGLFAARPDEDPLLLAAAAVWLHGVAGRYAAAGERPVTAVDVRDHLPQAIAAARTGDLAGCGL